MKWFWRINYFVTIYGVVIFVLSSFVSCGMIHNNTLNTILAIISIHDVVAFLTVIFEWIQFPLCLIAMIFWKKERTTLHFFYLVSMVIVSLIKWVLLLLAMASAAGMN